VLTVEENSNEGFSVGDVDFVKDHLGARRTAFTFSTFLRSRIRITADREPFKSNLRSSRAAMSLLMMGKQG
jgi:hypothetical protein